MDVTTLKITLKWLLHWQPEVWITYIEKNAEKVIIPEFLEFMYSKAIQCIFSVCINFPYVVVQNYRKIRS